MNLEQCLQYYPRKDLIQDFKNSDGTAESFKQLLNRPVTDGKLRMKIEQRRDRFLSTKVIPLLNEWQNMGNITWQQKENILKILKNTSPKF